jgi:serine/threonine-protein kinase
MRELRKQVRDARRFGQYFLEEEIGRGGMGVVYRAHHVLMQRATAIKVLSPEVSSPELIARFEREVQLTCQLTHPNTIAIYDYGRTRDGEFYYVMEYVDGITFDHLVRHDGRQPIGRAVHLIRQVCSALREAHGSGIIHRDLNPANLMLTVRGAVADVVKVLDFGLVKKMMPGELGIPSVDPASMPMAVSGATRLASTVQTVAARPSAPRSPGPTARQGLFLGAAGYASPEVIVGGTTDARSDLYGLGAVWFLLLAGRPAFDDLGTTAIFTAQMRDEPPRPSAVAADAAIPPVIDDLVARCLSRDPGKRPQSVDEILAVLDGPEMPGWSVDEAGKWWRTRAPVVRAKIVRGHVGVETRDTIDVRVERVAEASGGAEVAGEMAVGSGGRGRGQG